MRRKSRALTLIEILVVCLVLSTAFGGVAIFSYKVYEKMRFEMAIERVVGTIREKKLQALVEDKDLKWRIKWPGALFFNGREVQSQEFVFYCNGVIRPEGELQLKMKERSYALEIS